MKLRDKTLLITATLAAATVAYILIKRDREKKAHMLDSIADEGYETAHDILYPLKPKKRIKMNFGHRN